MKDGNFNYNTLWGKTPTKLGEGEYNELDRVATRMNRDMRKEKGRASGC